MAERVDDLDASRGGEDVPALRPGDPGQGADGIIEHADGSSAKVSTQDGHLSHDDVENSPFLDGTDPLSDDAIDRRRGPASLTPQLVVFTLLTLVFIVFLINDVIHGAWGKAVLGVVVLGICAFAIARELRQKR